MTPLQMVRAECANMFSDGTCLFIQPSSWTDYRMALPDWLDEQQWDALVVEARRQGELMIRADITSGGPLDTAQPHANRHRLDMYYCRGCDCRMGGKGDICQDCAGVPYVPDDVDRRCLVARGKRCRYFEKAVLPIADQPSPKDEPTLQARRLKARESYLRKHRLGRFSGSDGGQASNRLCPDCGGPLAKRKRYCQSCADGRRKGTYRQSRKNSREVRATVKADLAAVSPYGTRAENRPRSGSVSGAVGSQKKRLTVAPKAQGVKR